MPKRVLRSKPSKSQETPTQAELSTNTFDSLDPKQQIFVKEYIVDFNGTRAALETGCSKTSAGVVGSKLLDNPRVSRAIAEAIGPMMREAELSTERVLKQLYNFLFYDITPYIRSDGSLKCDPKELPESIRQAIVRIDGDEKFDREGNLLSTKIRIHLTSKDSALKMAMQYLKLMEPDTNINLKQDFFTVFYQQANTHKPIVLEGKVNKQEMMNGNGKAK